MNAEVFTRKIQGYYCPTSAQDHKIVLAEIYRWASERKEGTLDTLWDRLVKTVSREYRYVPGVAELQKMWVDMSFEVPQIAPDYKRKLLTDGARDYSKELGEFMRDLVSKKKVKEAKA